MDSGRSQNDDLKWFGEGFDGFPKRLPEDTLEYMVHVAYQKYPGEGEARSRLNAFLVAANALSKKLLKTYIWQREAYALRLVREDGRWTLSGRTNYGDSVADEWLIVYLLRETSKMFPEAWVRVYDTDGEFLLIEAANALPKWLNPEVAENRVWIHEGKLKIIPLQPSAPKSISLQEAVNYVASSPAKLVQSPLIEEEAFYRLRDYPSQISQNLHHSVITIPRSLAYILHSLPQSISPATEAFYLRDPIAARPLQTEDSRALTFGPLDLVRVSTRFTKVGFAQLRSQDFPAPPAWKTALPTSGETHHIQAAEIGMKVASGFEMLLSDPQNQDKRSVREIKLLLDDIASGDDALPADEDIKNWEQREDDDSWLDINFDDFERELTGKRNDANGAASPAGPGFGDKAAQENLQKMVERFESFLNDDDAGPDGAEEWDDMDRDDDEDDEDDSDLSSEGEDKDVSFDENEFTRMMREMVGMPPDDDASAKTAREMPNKGYKIEEIEGDDEDEDEAEEIRKLSDLMEAELRPTGALSLVSPSTTQPVRNMSVRHNASVSAAAKENHSDESDEELNVDFNLAKNMLESLKGQAGMAGPAGNLMGMMGVRMPRDEDDKKSD